MSMSTVGYFKGRNLINFERKHSKLKDMVTANIQEGISIDCIMEGYNVSKRNSHSLRLPRVRTSS